METGRCIVKLPIGRVEAWATERGVRGWTLAGRRRCPPAGAGKARAHLEAFSAELRAYFEGKLRDFTVPLALEGTPFQLRVWAQLRRIPYGETRSYADIARAIGKPRAARAVGQAVGRNPVGILVPCHRVVGTRGPGGWSGAPGMKERLLALEGAR